MGIIALVALAVVAVAALAGLVIVRIAPDVDATIIIAVLGFFSTAVGTVGGLATGYSLGENQRKTPGRKPKS